MQLVIVVDSISFQLPITQLPISGVGGELAGAAVVDEGGVLLGLGLVERVELGARVALVGEKGEVDDEHVLEDLLLVEAEVGGAQARVRRLPVECGDGGGGRVLVVAVAQGALE